MGVHWSDGVASSLSPEGASGDGGLPPMPLAAPLGPDAGTYLLSGFPTLAARHALWRASAATGLIVAWEDAAGRRLHLPPPKPVVCVVGNIAAGKSTLTIKLARALGLECRLEGHVPPPADVAPDALRPTVAQQVAEAVDIAAPWPGAPRMLACEELSSPVPSSTDLAPRAWPATISKRLFDEASKDPVRHGLAFQLSVRAPRWWAHMRGPLAGVCMEQCIYADELFLAQQVAEGHIHPLHAEAYLAEHAMLQVQMLPPDLIIYLSCSAERCYAAKPSRVRAEEADDRAGGVTLEYLRGLGARFAAVPQRWSAAGLCVLEIEWEAFGEGTVPIRVWRDGRVTQRATLRAVAPDTIMAQLATVIKTLIPSFDARMAVRE